MDVSSSSDDSDFPFHLTTPQAMRVRNGNSDDSGGDKDLSARNLAGKTKSYNYVIFVKKVYFAD